MINKQIQRFHNIKSFFKKNYKKAAFTLAETLTIIAVLGIIAIISVPSLISKYQYMVNRTKIKKAMSTYDDAIRKIVVENRISNLAQCAQLRKYYRLCYEKKRFRMYLPNKRRNMVEY